MLTFFRNIVKALAKSGIFVMRCTIWYHLYNFKNLKNNHGGVLILVKLQASHILKQTCS